MVKHSSEFFDEVSNIKKAIVNHLKSGEWHREHLDIFWAWLKEQGWVTLDTPRPGYSQFIWPGGPVTQEYNRAIRELEQGGRIRFNRWYGLIELGRWVPEEDRDYKYSCDDIAWTTGGGPWCKAAWARDHGNPVCGMRILGARDRQRIQIEKLKADKATLQASLVSAQVALTRLEDINLRLEQTPRGQYDETLYRKAQQELADRYKKAAQYYTVVSVVVASAVITSVIWAFIIG